MFTTQSLTYQYPGAEPIRFPDVAVEQGGVLLLRGASGSGKSTWLALAGGLLRPTQGSVTVAGQALGGLSPTQRDAWRARTVGFLPQKLHLSEALSVADNLALVYFAAGLRRDDAAIARALAALGLGALARRRPSQLSGGQAQRVALARAVLLRPPVLLADEPTASLDDAAAQAAITLLTAQAAACGATLAIATHDARVLAALPAAKIMQISPESTPAGAGVL